MPSNTRTHRNEQKLTKTIIIVNICLISLWIPHSVVTTLSLIDDNFDLLTNIKTLEDISHWTPMGVYINTALNAIIYTSRIGKLRRFYTRRARLAQNKRPQHQEHVQGYDNHIEEKRVFRLHRGLMDIAWKSWKY